MNGKKDLLMREKGERERERKGPHNNIEVRNHVHYVGVNRPINIITPYHTKYVRIMLYVCTRWTKILVR